MARSCGSFSGFNRGSYLVKSAFARAWRAIIVCLGLAALLGPGRAGAFGEASRALAQSAEHHAGVVIQYADGSVQTYCVPFAGDSIDGLSLLLKTGLDVQYEAYGMGGLVCKIGHDGCDYPGQPCVCQSYGPGGVYWSYHHLKNGKWQSSPTGASSYQVRDGDVDGWAWTDGKPPSKVVSLSTICGQSTAPAITPSRTATPRPRATSTRRPSTAPSATYAPRPTEIPAAPPSASAAAAPGAFTLTGTPTSTATMTGTASPTASTTLTGTPPPSPAVLDTPTTIAPGPTPALPPGGQQPSDDGAARARVIAVIVGLGSAGAFIAWRLIAAASHGSRGGKG